MKLVSGDGEYGGYCRKALSTRRCIETTPLHTPVHDAASGESESTEHQKVH